jgi:hypothetical protein
MRDNHAHLSAMLCFLYILRCADGSFYTGTYRGENLATRVSEHNLGHYVMPGPLRGGRQNSSFPKTSGRSLTPSMPSAGSRAGHAPRTRR